MTWRGSTTPQDRFFACLPYLLPLLEVLPFGTPLFVQFPFLTYIFLPIIPLAGIYNGVPFVSLIVFFALFLLVVRNESINHFIRFNAMQSILLLIILFLCNLIVSLVLQPLGGGLITETILNVIFLGTIAAVIYSIVQTAMGRYAEIPTLSEAVYMQVR